MQIHTIGTGATQMAESAVAVANGLTKARTTAGSSMAAAGTGSGSGTTSSTSSSSGGSTGAATITANDFLTLLVAEMKNQDPTQPTDPTAYISQMVDVNSLQQLVGINAGITSLDTAAGASTTGTGAVSGTGS